MKQLTLATAFVTAGWLIAVAVYTIYECTMVEKGYRPVSTFEYREGLINALNFAFPAVIACLIFLLRTNQADPISTEIFLLCMIVSVLGAFLAFKAKDHAYPDPADPAFAEAVWWLPDPDPDPYGIDDY